MRIVGLGILSSDLDGLKRKQNQTLILRSGAAASRRTRPPNPPSSFETDLAVLLRMRIVGLDGLKRKQNQTLILRSGAAASRRTRPPNPPPSFETDLTVLLRMRIVVLDRVRRK
jgi:hypothetical protein